MALDLYACAKEDPARFLSYSRRKADYGQSGEYNRTSLTAVTQVVAFLESAGYASTRPGSYSRRANPFGGADVGTGYRSRTRAEPLLVALMEDVFGVTSDSIAAGNAIAGRPIRLRAPIQRGAGKRYLPFSETPMTQAMARRVTDANRLRAHHTYSFDGERPARLTIDKGHLHRVFSNGRWDHGGRFYGGWWQGLPSIDRARILIDGEDTVELDFRAYQPRLAFHLEGHPLAPADDPYSLPGHDPAIYREAVKTVFAKLLNAAPGVPIRASESMKGLFAKDAFPAFVGEVEAAFAAIRPWLRTGRGMELQFIDSEIADGVIEALTVEGIPCLPVHDSFIVPRSAEVRLGRLMYEVYRRRLLERTGIAADPVLSGWSSSEAEQLVRSSLS
ncbi:MAG: hypothetical protein J7495_18940 [Sphingomonas sp.]|nr:hypothetical protein [Sphingomonas sp.]